MSQFLSRVAGTLDNEFPMLILIAATYVTGLVWCIVQDIEAHQKRKAYNAINA